MAFVIVYFLYTIPLFIIAYKAEHPQSLLAFIPLINIWLMLDMADLSPVWLLLCLVPFGGLVVYTYIWMRIAQYTNKSEWLGLLMLIPVVNLVTVYYMAFYEPSKIR